MHINGFPLKIATAQRFTIRFVSRANGLNRAIGIFASTSQLLCREIEDDLVSYFRRHNRKSLINRIGGGGGAFSGGPYYYVYVSLSYSKSSSFRRAAWRFAFTLPIMISAAVLAIVTDEDKFKTARNLIPTSIF